MVENAPEWPKHVEVVEVTPLDLKSGDTLVVRPKDGHLPVEVSMELREHFEYFFPDAQIMVVGLPVDLEVRPAQSGGA